MKLQRIFWPQAAASQFHLGNRLDRSPVKLGKVGMREGRRGSWRVWVCGGLNPALLAINRRGIIYTQTMKPVTLAMEAKCKEEVQTPLQHMANLGGVSESHRTHRKKQDKMVLPGGSPRPRVGRTSPEQKAVMYVH